MRVCENGIYRDLTTEEISAVMDEQAKAEAEEKRRPLTESEVTAMLIRQQINTLTVDDQTALRMMEYYPPFSDIIGKKVPMGFKFTYNGKLYKTAQPEMTIAKHYPPEAGTESLYTRIDETHDGTKYDPIPYEGNMALENGKYYTESGVVYLCIRDTGNAVYQPLAELVGLYVETSYS